MAKICIFVKKWPKKIHSKLLKQTISYVFLPKNSIHGAKNSLKCENFGQFQFFVIFVQIKSGKNKEDSHYR